MPVSTSSPYVIYARKSSESENRQVLSIDAQVQELKTLAQRRGFEVGEVLTEARSAKEPGRPVFSNLVGRISRGQVKGILCWKLDRLARNPVDGGSIIWAMKQYGLSIQTPTQSYGTEEDNLILMYIEFGMAQKYIDDLSQNVKRGNRMKLEKGGLPGPAPHGYLNDAVNGNIIPDPERFQLVRRMWDMMLTGACTVAQIVRLSNDEWGYRTRQAKRVGGCKLHATALYKTFANPFYYGLIRRRLSGKLEFFPGAHKPMVTEDEFRHVQRLLGRGDRPRPQKHTFNYIGLMVCGECGASITAEEHRKKSGRRYVYYRCTKKPGPCQQPYIPQGRLEEQINGLLGQITISNDFREWGIERFKKAHNREIKTRTAMYQRQQAAYNAAQRQLDNLIGLRLRDLISEEEYVQKRQELQREQASLKLKLADTEDRAAKWLELAERAFIFANKAQKAFEEGSDEQKREIFAALGSNFILKDGIISITLRKPFEILRNANLKNERPLSGPETFASGAPWARKFELLVEQIETYFREGANQVMHIPDLMTEPESRTASTL